MTLNLQKTEFFSDAVNHLGYEINNQTLNKQESKIQKLLDFTQKHWSQRKNAIILKNERQVQQLLGLTNFYQKFIPNYQSLVRPLTAIASQNKFHWDTEQIQAVQQLKNAFCEKFQLQKPDYQSDFHLVIETEMDVINGCLYQKNPDTGEKYIICFVSKVMQPCQQRYTISEKKIFALYVCLK